ncbi:MAG: MBL fold metallo-hydrolase [Candidatus Diapherotrites archaeon]|nr:MBL fold metallo-hydrolase [Candidatus Diapherotrites archaeon]
MRFFDDNGLVIANGCSIVIDSSRTPKADFAVITHAHSDHLFSKKEYSGKVLATPETKALINGRLNEDCLIGKCFSEKHSFESFDISLENSGHILGSSQVVLEGEKRVVVTSDFQLQDSLLLPRAEVQKADVLIIESTFGKPSFQFPERQEVYEDIGKWVEENSRSGKFSLLSGYALGKAQELSKIVNEFSNEVPAVHEKVFEFNKIYESNGCKIGDFEKLNGNLKDFNVAIIPPSLVSKDLVNALQISLGKKVVSGIATGWGFYGKKFNKTFPLSDHADFRQLMHYVEESGAKKVITMHGFSQEFARHLNRKLGINAAPLCGKGQKSIQEFCE